MSAGIRRRQLPRRLSGTCCAAPATRHSLPSRPTQSSGNLRVDPPYHVQSPQRIFQYVLLSLRCAGVKNWCVSTAPADRSKLWMGRCRTAASARPIRVAQPCHFRRSPEILGSTSPATKLRFTSSATTLATMSYPPGS